MFGGQSLGGDELLMGSGVPERTRSGSGSASGGSTPGGTAVPTSFDLSQDFPSLGGRGRGSVLGGLGLQGGDGLSSVLRQQQQQHMLQQQQQQLMLSGADASNNYRIATAGQGNVNMAAEEFPALSSAPQKGNPPSNNSSPFLGSAQAVSRINASGPDDAIGGSGGGIGGGSNPLFNGLSGGFAGLSIGGDNRGNNPAAPSTSSDGAGSAIHSDYGLLGLLSVIRMTDADRNALALGSDLQSLGLNVKSSDKLYNTFGSPFVDTPATREPSYHIPMCYYMNPPALKTGHLSKFTLEILFYVFHAMPKDGLQAYAAQELYSRQWRYHVELKLWFKRAEPGDGVDLSDGATKYIYFDWQTWDRRHFSGNIQQLAGGFLSEDDVRVKS